MRVIMFKKQFTEKILSGEKVSTIRPKARCKPGDTLSLRNWEGKPYRSKHKIIMETQYKSLHKISIYAPNKMILESIDTYPQSITLIPMHYSEAHQIARMEGFSDSNEMIDFFLKTHGLPFEGMLIYWGANPFPTWGPI